MKLLIDRKSKLPRIWSNRELKKFAHLYTGAAVNVSGWKDQDKEGSIYKDYFCNCSSYQITNYLSEARGLQGIENEIFLDLEADLPQELKHKYDVVFNHTVLEHVFEVHKAIENLCLMSKDTVIVVVPFLQPMHADYGDFWRFTPSCLQKLFRKNNFEVLYCSYNSHIDAAVYLFCIASKSPEKWRSKILGNFEENGEISVYQKPWIEDGFPHKVGTNGILNLWGILAYKWQSIRRKMA